LGVWIKKNDKRTVKLQEQWRSVNAEKANNALQKTESNYTKIEQPSTKRLIPYLAAMFDKKLKTGDEVVLDLQVYQHPPVAVRRLPPHEFEHHSTLHEAAQDTQSLQSALEAT